MDSLTLNDDNDLFGTTVNPFETSHSVGPLSKESEFKEVKTFSKMNEINNEERLKKFQGAKSISSDAFKDNM